MSQEKVDKYKEYKANKAKIMKKEKMVRRIEIGALALVVVAVLAVVGVSFFIEKNDSTNVNATVTEMDATALDEYITSLSETEAE